MTDPSHTRHTKAMAHLRSATAKLKEGSDKAKASLQSHVDKQKAAS
jgi:hypothetical protein